MVMIPPKPEQQIIERIYKAIQLSETKPTVYLGRLGSSFIGEECVRRIWLDWRGFAREQFEGRILRLFDTGHQQETRIIADLRAAGLEVWDLLPDGEQYQFSDDTGHFVTKMDGVVKGVPESEKTAHVLEIKTHNKNSFASLVKKGVKDAKPAHYAQIQMTMALSGLSRALYVSICKDDEQFYIERVKEDKTEQARLRKRVLTLVQARMRPAGVSEDGSGLDCRFCGMKAVCTHAVDPLRHCRTCKYAEPAEEGKWVCAGTGEELSMEQQLAGCNEYTAL